MSDPQLPEHDDEESGNASDADTIKAAEEEGVQDIAAILEEERAAASTPQPIGGTTVAERYHKLQELELQDEAPSEADSSSAAPQRAGSPIGSLLSVPDDLPSARASVVSSPSSSILPSVASRPGLSSPTPSFRPFDRRFVSRQSSSSLLSPHRPSSPAFLAGHGRTGSISSQLGLPLDPSDTDTPSPPWEVVRWTKLRKLNGQAFSEAGKRNFGSPTCLFVSAAIVVGTSKGVILMFDYNQNLKLIIGPGTKAVESGAVTSIAVSADHNTIGGGHANGNIFTWDTTRPSRPFLSIPHLDAAQMQNRTQDGHLPGVAVTHLSFLGTRHTALVSADDRGMAFSHLATRGTGALGRSVKTTRILGRYPDSKPLPSGKTLKPSTVLGLAALPLGNVDQATDSMGLTAMLTPYLLVIVSTTPIAQTQHKSARPKEVAAHGAMTGCLAWFPAVKLKVADSTTGSQISKAKLVYCWSDVLTVLDVDEVPAEEKDKPPILKFKARSRWRSDEAIVAVQWLSRSVLTVLTITQRLVVLEDRSMRVTEAFDLANRHIFHSDLFSKQLHTLVEQLDEDDTSMHGVVADAFYMSFKAYKGRLFLLGFNDLSIGALSNWADRLIALMEHGDYIGAINLATSYYTGDADKLTVGLPEDTAARHSMVRDKVMEIMSASLKYAFGQWQKSSKKEEDDRQLQELAETCFTACQSVNDADFLFDEMYEWYEDSGVQGIFLETLEPYILDKTITIIPPTVVKAMVAHYTTKGLESRLEDMLVHMNPATLDLDQVTQLCKQHGLYDALIYVWNQGIQDYITPFVELLALLVPLMENGDYFVSEHVMNDENVSVNALKLFPYLSYTLTGRVYPTGDRIADDASNKAKAELYWLLFSGKRINWPRGSAKEFFTRPADQEQPSFPYLRMILKFDAPSFLSALNEAFEDPFLNDSPEKQTTGLINRDLPEEQVFGLTVDRQYVVSILMEIMNSNDFAAEDTIYLDMFIARNLPKYPQYLLFPGSTLTKVLTGLCNYPGDDLAEDAQLSAEYLLSVHQAPDVNSFIPLFKKAGFYRILKRIYRQDKEYGKLITTYFEDPDDQEGVFDCIDDVLRLHAEISKRQVEAVQQVIKDNARQLLEFDASRAAQILDAHAPQLHDAVLTAAEDDPELQFVYLKSILEPDAELARSESKSANNRVLVEKYIQLMCRFEPTHVADYVGSVPIADLRLEKLLGSMEEAGQIDAAVVLMTREGLASEAMGRLVRHLGTLETALQGILQEESSSPNADSTGPADEQANSESGPRSPRSTMNNGDMQSAAEELMRALQKYVHVGIWLCQSQGQSLSTSSNTTSTSMVAPASKSKRRGAASTTSASGSEGLSPVETLWLDLIDASVQVTRRLSATIESERQRTAAAATGDSAGGTRGAGSHEDRNGSAAAGDTASRAKGVNGHRDQGGRTGGAEGPSSYEVVPLDPGPSVIARLDTEKLINLLRSLVQHTFTALLAATSAPPIQSSPSHPRHASGQKAGSAAPSEGNISFLRILRAFLSHAAVSSPTIADLRQVLQSIFSAYAYEENILQLSSRLLDKSLFGSVKTGVELRQRGWRPRGSACEACGRRVWGPGLQGNIVGAWEEWTARDEGRRKDRMERRLGVENGKGKGVAVAEPAKAVPRKGKGKETSQSEEERTQEAEMSSAAKDRQNGAADDEGKIIHGMRNGKPELEALVVFACRHIYHQSCLEAIQAGDDRLPTERERDYRCPIDG